MQISLVIFILLLSASATLMIKSIVKASGRWLEQRQQHKRLNTLIDHAMVYSVVSDKSSRLPLNNNQYAIVLTAMLKKELDELGIENCIRALVGMMASSKKTRSFTDIERAVHVIQKINDKGFPSTPA